MATYTISASVTGMSFASRSAITSMCMVMLVRPTRSTVVLNFTTSPTITGCLNSTRLMATVTKASVGDDPIRSASRRAPMLPAVSM